LRVNLADPGVVSRFAALGMLAGGQTPAEFTSRIQAETAQLKRALEKLKIQPE